MSYTGKFIDRAPIICAAGKTVSGQSSVKDVFKSNYEADFVDKILSDLRNVKQNDSIPKRLAKRISKEFGAKEVVNPEDKTNFQLFQQNLRESIYDSSKRKPLGKGSGHFSSSGNVVFGKPTEEHVSAYDVIMPGKSPKDALLSDAAAHRNYVISHGDYYPSEQIDRKYDRRSYNQNECFGRKCVLSPNECFTYPSQEGVSRKPLLRQKASTDLPQNYTFGKQSEKKDGVNHILYNETPKEDCKSVHECVTYLRKLKDRIRKIGDIEIYDIRKMCRDQDNESSGSLKITLILEILAAIIGSIDTTKIKNALKIFNLARDDQTCDFERFIDLLGSPGPIIPPRSTKVETFDPNQLTTYRELSTDLFTKDTLCGTSPAGMPSAYSLKTDLEMLGSETDVHTLISPSIPTLFGFSHRDYLLPRSKDEIRSIFTKVHKSLRDDQTFETLWSDSLKVWPNKNDLVSVEAFRYALKTNQTKSS